MVVLDFELTGFNTPALDLVYTLFHLSYNWDIDFDEKLKFYHDKLTSIGPKVTKESYPYAKLREHFVKFFMPKNAFVGPGIASWAKGEFGEKILRIMADFCKKEGITAENVGPSISIM